MNPEASNEVREVIQGRTLDRWPYFWWGCCLMAVKYNLDRFIAWLFFNRAWYFWNYIEPSRFARIDTIPPGERSFYLVLLLTSLPFLAAGIFLTLHRLRSASAPPWLCLLFFVPVVNMVFFVVLCLLPEKRGGAALQQPPRPGWMAWLPASRAGGALASMLFVGGTGVGCVYFSTSALQNYGWGLFVALPFAMGLVSVLIYAGQARRTLEACMLVSVLPVIFCGICLLAVAAEGAVCLLMAAPIALLLALFGGVVGYAILGNRLGTSTSPTATMMLALLSVPVTMSMEKQAGEAPPLHRITTAVVIDARPARVWPNVTSFSPIPPERDWILHTGVAYPLRARIDGRGPGAIRHCIFTTGEFVEPIEIWDEPHLLRFSVSSQPEPMEELSPYGHLKTRHLEGYLQSREGELRLTELTGGRTLLEGTTWYTDRIWPTAYWQFWSDLVITRIHLRVMNHIKKLSERADATGL